MTTPLEHLRHELLTSAAAHTPELTSLERAVTTRRRKRRAGLAIATATAAAAIVVGVANGASRSDSTEEVTTAAASAAALVDALPSNRFGLDVDAVVYLAPDAPTSSIDAVLAALEDDPDVEAFRYANRNVIYQEFKRLFADQPEFIDAVPPEALPTFFEVTVADATCEPLRSLGTTLGGMADVLEVTTTRSHC